MLNKKINFKNANQVDYLHIISLKKKSFCVILCVSFLSTGVSSTEVKCTVLLPVYECNINFIDTTQNSSLCKTA